MSAYDAWSAAAGAWTLLLTLALGVLFTWCVIELTRWVTAVIRRAWADTSPDRLRQVATTRTWIDEWETSRTPENTAARTQARTGRTTP